MARELLACGPVFGIFEPKVGFFYGSSTQLQQGLKRLLKKVH